MEWVVLMYDDRELKPEHLGILQPKQALELESEKKSCLELKTENFSLPERGLDLEDYINKIVAKAMDLNRGNKTETARYLGISRSSLYCRLERIERN